MRKYRFPKMAYVRQLERLYDDLAMWQRTYLSDASLSLTEREALPLEIRAEHLDETQRRVLRVITQLHELPDLS